MSIPKGLTKEQITIFNKCREEAIKHFEEIGELPKDRDKYEYCLHHKDSSWRTNDIDRYIHWYFDDLEVVLYGHHTTEHNIGNQNTKGKHWKWSDEQLNNHPRYKKVECVETGQQFITINSANKWCGSRHVGDCCVGKRNTAGGYHWRFVNE